MIDLTIPLYQKMVHYYTEINLENQQSLQYDTDVFKSVIYAAWSVIPNGILVIY